MKDLTQGSVRGALIAMSVPIAVGMLFQTLYFIVDLYFVSRISDQAIAGVGSAGTATFIILGLTQMLSVGTVALVAQAVGRKDQPGANLVFNQAVLLSLLCGIAVALAGILVTGPFMRLVAADAASAAAGASYLYWYTPGLALQFAMVALISGLRGTGIVKPTMMVQMITVVVNIVLAPILVAGWLTHHPMGTAGAGLASSIAVIVGVVMLWVYFARLEHYVGFDRTVWPPRWKLIRGILNIGLPAGGEFLMMFVILSVIYVVIRGFGPEAQAGFGIGGRVMQALFVPVLAIAFGATPVAGQNFGARRFDRVRETFWQAVILSSSLMLLLTLAFQVAPQIFIRFFSQQPEVVSVGAGYLRVISWNFVASGLIFASAGLFQALGNTWPSFLASASRLITFVLPALWLASRPGFTLEQVWHLSVATVALQAATSLTLLFREFRRRLPASGSIPAAPPAPPGTAA